MTLANKYSELMSRVELTGELRERILCGLSGEPGSGKAVRFAARRRIAAAAACLTILIAAAFLLPRLSEKTKSEPTQTASPITEYESADALAKAVGFPISGPASLPFTPVSTSYSAYNGSLAEITCEGAEGQIATYRKSRGAGDNSGDYNTYADVTGLTAAAGTVTLRGEAGRYVLAVWSDGTYSYSLSLTPGLSRDDWSAVLVGLS